MVLVVFEYSLAHPTRHFLWILFDGLVDVGLDHVAGVIVGVLARLLLRLVIIEGAFLLLLVRVLCVTCAGANVEPVSIILLARQVVELIELTKYEFFPWISYAAGDLT